MVRPREFDEAQVLQRAMEQFWKLGYERTSTRELTSATGLTTASLYNAFGSKRSLYQRALHHYVEQSVAARIARCDQISPVEAIELFFEEVIGRSVLDPNRKGCMLVNAALEVSGADEEMQIEVAEVFTRIREFFFRSVERGHRDSTIDSRLDASDMATAFLGAMLGIRVLARSQPEAALLRAVVRPLLAMLKP